MPIAVTASGGQFVTRVLRLLASLSHLANDRPMHYRFFTFWPRGANAWAKVHQKGRRPGRLLDLPSCKIPSPYVNPRPGYPLPKILRTNRKTDRQTVNDISPARLSACGDNKYIDSIKNCDYGSVITVKASQDFIELI